MKNYEETLKHFVDSNELHEVTKYTHPPHKQKREWVVEHYWPEISCLHRNAGWYIMHRCIDEEHANKMLEKEIRSCWWNSKPEDWRIRKL